MRRLSLLNDSPDIRGMLEKVHYLVDFIDDGEFLSRTAQARPHQPEPKVPDATDGLVDRQKPPQVLLSEARNILTRISRDRASDFETWAAAATEASRYLASKKEIAPMFADDAGRRERVSMAKQLYRTMFAGDESKAKQAAYILVANSKNFGDRLDPEVRVQTLTSAQLSTFREGLIDLLEALNIRWISTVIARRTADGDSGNAVVEIVLTVTKALPFELDGKKVLLRSVDRVFTDGESLQIGCSIAEERLLLEVTSSPERGDGQLLEAHASFAIPKERLDDGIVPVSVVSPWLVEHRRIPLQSGER